MSTATTKETAIDVPEEVRAFAVAQGVDVYLTAILEMTRRLFPDAEISLAIEDDPEIPDEKHIIVGARNVRLSVELALRGRWTWHRELFGACPAPLVCVFRLALEIG
jgi:hypothetical protein